MEGVVVLLILTLLAADASPAAEPAFQASISRPPAAVLARARETSWRPGCPVPLDALAYLRVRHLGYDGQVHDGELLVHRSLAPDLVALFRALFALRFPIEKMRLIDAYDGDDDASMADNNTSAFNCREVAGSPKWSRHAYGMAIDINPLVNPWVVKGTVAPPEGAAYLAAPHPDKGTLRAGDPAVRLFLRRGFTWGGNFKQSKDYQHFQK
jgi:hypothetical protein